LTVVETCAECRFDGAHYNRTDARRSLATMAIRWRWAGAGVDEAILATRPSPDQLSPTEHASIAAGSIVTTTFADAVDQLMRLDASDEELLTVVHRTSTT
jgi:hypothetical protein